VVNFPIITSMPDGARVVSLRLNAGCVMEVNIEQVEYLNKMIARGWLKLEAG